MVELCIRSVLNNVSHTQMSEIYVLLLTFSSGIYCQGPCGPMCMLVHMCMDLYLIWLASVLLPIII